MDVAELRFREAFGGDADGLEVSEAPGRVNIIGEHTDYNDGFVLPTPINRCIRVAARQRKGSVVNMYAIDYGQRASFDLESIEFDGEHRWANYVIGVADVLTKRGYKLGGADMAIWGDVPQGAGLGSSGALEMAAIKAFAALSGIEMDPVEMAYTGKSAENDFVGVRCGVMDQLSSVLGRPNHALFIDCRTNEYEHIPLVQGFVIVVVNTGVRRELASSEYNVRRTQCEEGVGILGRSLRGIKALRDVTTDQFERFQYDLPKVIRKRCRHVISENARVLEAVKALKEGDMERLGELMYESHASLRDDYEVSCKELDLLVESAKGIRGAVGSRMMGAGFGGCTVNFVEEGHVQNFVQAVKDRYGAATGITPEVYV